MLGLFHRHYPIYGPGGEVGQHEGGGLAKLSRQVSLQLSPTAGAYNRCNCISCYMYV